MLFCTSLWRTIFPFYNLCSSEYLCQAKKKFIPIINKRMGIPDNIHKTRRILIKPFHHTFILDIDTSRVDFVLHILVPWFFHLYHFQKSISVLYLLIGESQSSKYTTKTNLLIYSFNPKGAPWNISVVAMDHQLCCEVMPSQKSI